MEAPAAAMDAIREVFATEDVYKSVVLVDAGEDVDAVVRALEAEDFPACNVSEYGAFLEGTYRLLVCTPAEVEALGDVPDVTHVFRGGGVARVK